MKFSGGRTVMYTVFVFLYLPVLILLVYSFNDSRFGLTWSGFTLRWYRTLFTNPEVHSAVKNTLIVSTSATAISVVLGTLLGVGLHLYRFPGRRIVEMLFYLPVIIPDIIMAISLLAFYVAVHLTLGYLSIILICAWTIGPSTTGTYPGAASEGLTNPSDRNRSMPRWSISPR